MTKLTQIQQPRFSQLIKSDNYQSLIKATLSDPKRVQRFVANITSAVAINKDLQECECSSILGCALLGESLNLSPSPQLGQFYMVPFNDTNTKTKKAQFILGYHGMIQLAIRSGQYIKLNVASIKEGELKYFDPITETMEVELIQDEIARETAETTGYYAMFQYLNGFVKSIYWSKTKMLEHALKYSKGFAKDKRNGTSYTFWSKNFDEMAHKTMLRQIIGKWGVMSIDMLNAFDKDGAIINEDQTAEYVDMQDIKELEVQTIKSINKSEESAEQEQEEYISFDDLNKE